MTKPRRKNRRVRMGCGHVVHVIATVGFMPASCPTCHPKEWQGKK